MQSNSYNSTNAIYVNYLSKVYGWMFVGLIITAIMGLITSTTPSLLIFSNSLSGVLILLIAEIILVLLISSNISRLNFLSAAICFTIFSVINGLTFGSVFVLYTLDSILLTFAVTAGIFGIMSVIGFVTKRDLSNLRNLFLVTLIGITVAIVVNLFLCNTLLDIIISIVGIATFMGLIVYDSQKIKRIYETHPNNQALAIYGALELYLDFINIFLHLLRIFGKSEQ